MELSLSCEEAEALGWARSPSCSPSRSPPPPPPPPLQEYAASSAPQQRAPRPPLPPPLPAPYVAELSSQVVTARASPRRR